MTLAEQNHWAMILILVLLAIAIVLRLVLGHWTP